MKSALQHNRNLPALGATMLALAYAAVSAYWALGGKIGLRSVGTSVIRLADSHTTIAAAVIWATVLVKVLCALLSYVLLSQKHYAGIRTINTIIASILVTYGAILVVSATLVETGVIRPHSTIDWYALKWHLMLWDMWFLVWGVLLLLAVECYGKGCPDRD